MPSGLSQRLCCNKRAVRICVAGCFNWTKGDPSLVSETLHSHITLSPATCHPVQCRANMRVADCTTVWVCKCLQPIYLSALHLTLFDMWQPWMAQPVWRFVNFFVVPSIEWDWKGKRDRKRWCAGIEGLVSVIYWLVLCFFICLLYVDPFSPIQLPQIPLDGPIHRIQGGGWATKTISQGAPLPTEYSKITILHGIGCSLNLSISYYCSFVFWECGCGLLSMGKQSIGKLFRMSGDPLLQKPGTFGLRPPPPHPNKHNRFQYMMPSHIKSCMAHSGGRGVRGKNPSFFVTEAIMAKKTQIQ